MADKNTIAFSLSLAAVETIRQVGNEMAQVNAAIETLSNAISNIDDTLDRLEVLATKLEACRGSR